MNQNNLHRVAVIAVFLLAAYLRLGQPGIVEFKRDEANLSLLALDMAQHGEIPLLGIGSSVGLPNAPVNVYILSIPYFLSTNPQLATQFIGLLNVFAVMMLYFFLRQYCDKWIALGVTLLFAVNPWAVMFSRKIWAQNMLPPFVIATIWTGVLGFLDGKKWAKIVHFPLLAITGQIHYGAFVIVPVTLYLLWQDRRRFSRELWLGLGFAILVTLPYIIGMQQAGLLNPDALRDAIHSTEEAEDDSLTLTTEPIEAARLLITGDEIHAFAGDRFVDFLDAVPDFYGIFGLLFLAFSIIVVYLLLSKRNPIVYVSLIWFVFPVVIYMMTWTPFFIHYLIPAIPAVYMILGLGFGQLLSHSQKMRRLLYIIGGVGGFAIVTGQIIILMMLFDFVKIHNTSNGFGTPLLYLNQAKEAVKAQGNPQVLADLGEQLIVYENEPTVWAVLLYDVDNLRFTDDMTHVFSAQPTTLLTRNCNANQVVSLREDEGCYAVESVEPLDTSAYTMIDTLPFANGVVIEGYHWTENCLNLLWKTTQTAQIDYQFSVNFMNNAGQSLFNGDAISWQSQYWQPEDQIIRTFCMPNDAEIALIDVGMYYFTVDGDIQPLDLLDSMGNPAGRYITLEVSHSQ